MVNDKWIKTMTNFMIRVFKVDKQFTQTISDFIENHEEEFRKKYKNTLALNKETKFKELQTCKTDPDIKKKLSEITKLKLVVKQEKGKEILITDAQNPEVIKFKTMRDRVRAEMKNNINDVLSLASTGKEREEMDMGELYPTGSVIPLPRFMPKEGSSLSIDFLAEALKVELGGKKYNPQRPMYLWKKVFMSLSDILESAEEKEKRMKLVKDKLLSIEVNIGNEKWKPLTAEDLKYLKQ